MAARRGRKPAAGGAPAAQKRAAPTEPKVVEQFAPTPVTEAVIDDDDFEDFDIDDVSGYGDDVLVEGGDQPGITLLDHPPEPEPINTEIHQLVESRQMTTTDSFMGGKPNRQGVRNLGKTVRNTQDPDARHIVRVGVDIGPVFVGSRKIQLSKDTRYEVDNDIYNYLAARKGVLVGE